MTAKLGVLLLAMCAAAAGAAEVTETLDRKFDLNSGGLLKLGHVSGAVLVRGTDSKSVVLHAIKHVNAGSDDEGRKALARVQIRITEKSGELRVETLYDNEGLWERLKGLFKSDKLGKVAVDYTLEVPKDARIELTSVSGSLWLRDSNASVKAAGVSGPIKLENLHGGIRVESVSGELRANDVSGEVWASTVSGALTAELSGASRCSAHSVSGAIAVKFDDTRFTGAELETVSGDVVLGLPADAGTSIEMKTVSGRAECKLPCQSSSGGKGWSCILGDGSRRIRVKTVSGDLKVEGAGGGSVETK